jgi:COP9 signalosome complex subunit 2
VNASHLAAAQLTFLPRYDFEYEEDDEDESADVDIENKYYNAKQLKTTDPEDAIAEFLGIPPLEEEKSEWGFKGLKQATKLEFKLAQYDKVSRADLPVAEHLVLVEDRC